MLTRQEIFDKAYIGCIINQKGVQAVDEEQGTCLYLDKDGRKCAIGQCIPDGNPMQKSNLSVSGLRTVFHAEFIKLFDVDDIRFLRQLQCCHDQASNPAHMKQNFEGFAATHNLTIPTPPLKTLQEVFDKAYRGCIVEQEGERSVESNNGFCRYRNDAGMKCAVGHCIPDGSPLLNREGQTPSGLLQADPDNFYKVFDKDIPIHLLNTLQSCHDGGKTPKETKENFLNYAKTHRLTVPTN